MKRSKQSYRVVLALLGIVAMSLLGACGHTASASKLQSQPNVKAAETGAQTLVQGCAKSNSFFTKAGRASFITCIAPPGKSKQVETCVQQAVAKDGFLTKGARLKLLDDAEKCVTP